MLQRTMWPVLLCGATWLAAGCATPPPTASPATQPGPPRVASRPAALVEILPTVDPEAESKVELSEAAGTLVGKNLRLADLVCLAVRTPDVTRSRIPLLSAVRVISDRPLGDQRYDLRIRLSGATAEELRAALRQRLETQFGLKIRNEWRQTDALVLRQAPGPRPKTALTARGGEADRRCVTLSGSDYALLAEQLEERLGQPVVNETDLRGAYELRLQEPLAKEPEPRLPLGVIQQALRQQLGLELIPARRVVEFLVVQQAAGAGSDAPGD